jgi:chromosome segregation ATPase
MLHDMEERWSMVNERAFLLNNQLDNEVKNKNALVNVQKEMEKHLSLERERADLLEQKLDAFKETDYQQRGELDRASQDNTHLKNELDQLGGELDRASQENMHLKNELDRVGRELGGELDRASQENMHLKNELDRVGRELGEELDRASQENKALKNELDRVHQQSVQELGRATEENKQLKSELERWGEDNMHLKSENDRFSQHLHIANEVGLTLKTNLTALQKDFEEQVQVSQSSASECLELKRVCQEFNIKMNNLSEINSLLEFKVERLEAKVLDQVIDLEAARMSEAEVEKSLAECENNRLELDELAQHLDAELRKTLNECQKINELYEDVSNEKGEMAAVLEEQIREIEAMKLNSAEDEHACNEERTEITGLLAGFDAEMSIAEEKLKSVLQSNADLESEIASLKAHLESEREASNMKLENSQIVIETLQDEVQKRLQAFKE